VPCGSNETSKGKRGKVGGEKKEKQIGVGQKTFNGVWKRGRDENLYLGATAKTK